MRLANLEQSFVALTNLLICRFGNIALMDLQDGTPTTPRCAPLPPHTTMSTHACAARDPVLQSEPTTNVLHESSSHSIWCAICCDPQLKPSPRAQQLGVFTGDYPSECPNPALCTPVAVIRKPNATPEVPGPSTQPDHHIHPICTHLSLHAS